MEFPTFDELLDIDYTNPRWYDLEDLPNEVWKDIKGYEGLYQISNYGRVKSLSKIGKGAKIPRILKQRTDRNGYLSVTLSIKSLEKSYGVHVLVAKNFIPNPKCKPTVNHEDGIKVNNKIDNLVWATQKEQLDHSFRMGLRKHQCNIQRRCCIIYPNNNVESFEALSHLSAKLGYKKGFCHNRIRKYGNVFYEKGLMIVILDSDTTIPLYKPPTVYDVNLQEYCKLNNLNYSTVRARKTRGWNICDCVKPTNKGYVDYTMKEGDNDEVCTI